MFILKILSALLCLSVLESSVVPESHRDYQFIQEEANRLGKLASALSSSFNTNVNPCDNYFKYVTSGDHTEITKLLPPQLSQAGIYALYDQFIANGTGLTHAEKQVKICFESCQNIKDGKPEDNIKNLDIKNIVGNFPALDAAWTEDQFDWADVEAKFRHAGNPVFLDSSPLLEDGLWSVNVKLAPKNFFTVYYKLDKYEKVFKPFGFDDESIATLKSELSDLEKHFGVVPYTDNVTEVTIDYLKEQVPEFDWEAYFAKVIGKDIKNLGKIYLYIDNIDDLTDRFKAGASNKKRLAHFYFMTLIAELHLEYQIIRPPNFCYERTLKYFPDVFGNIFLKHRVDEHDMENTLLVIETLFQQITDELERKTVSEKLNELRDYQQIIGLKGEVNDDIVNSYKNLHLATDDYILNVLRSQYANPTRHQTSPLSYEQSMMVIQNCNLLHGQPRLLYALAIGMSLFRDLKDKFDYTEVLKNQTPLCHDALYSKMDLARVLDFVDSLSSTDTNKYLNEVETLKKYDLTPTKFIFAAFCMIGDLNLGEVDTFEQMLFSQILFKFKQLTDAYGCEVDAELAMEQSCKL